jgi:hypothetical protein
MIQEGLRVYGDPSSIPGECAGRGGEFISFKANDFKKDQLIFSCTLMFPSKKSAEKFGTENTLGLL